MRTTVKDVMTGKVTTVTANTPFREIAETLIAGGISAVPVIDDDDHVIGMVSEADLLRKEEFREEFYREGYRPPLRARLRHPKGRQKASGDTAGELMTSPPITITAEASAVIAARSMDRHDVKRLAVVDARRPPGRHRQPPRPGQAVPAGRRRPRHRGPRRGSRSKPVGGHRARASSTCSRAS